MFSQAMLSDHLFPSPRGQHDAGSFWSADAQLSKRKKEVGTLSRVIKVYQEMYQNSHVYPCIAMYCHVLQCIAMYYHVLPYITMYSHL